jgi:hypothetical protein
MQTARSRNIEAVPVDYEQPPALRKSAALHERVVSFAKAQLGSLSSPRLDGDSFESLAVDIARFQYELNPGFARAVMQHTGRLEILGDLPLVPTDVFRLCRVAVHPPELDQIVFRTSGTTAEQTGNHPVRLLQTKEHLALLQAERTLFSDFKRGVVVALSPPPREAPSSSLVHLMQTLMKRFDGRALSSDPEGVAFRIDEPGRFLCPAQGIDIEGLKRAARVALHRSEAFFILTTSFALLATLEELDGEKLRCPDRTVIMITGGFKGRRTELSEDDLRQRCASTFSISPQKIIGEYGMTELSSQLFESDIKGIYAAPPWLRVAAVAPHDFRQVREGEPGLAHFIDLANVDSCLSIVTQDLVRQVKGGIELLGRAPRAIPRGCSLPFEGLLLAASDAPTRTGQRPRGTQ